MKEQRIVIAGAGGYLGTNVLPTLSRIKDVNILAISSKETINMSFCNSNVEYIKLSMDEYDEVKDYLPDKCDVAVNFSWIGTRGEDQDEETVQKRNEDNSIALLKALIDVGCKKFIQIGSMAEYGIVKGVITEKSECHPITSYATRKLICAKKMKTICDEAEVNFIELRMGSMYGNYMECGNIIGFLCRELSKGHHVSLKTSCEQDWEYTHVDDFADILSIAVTTDIPAGIYNVTNGKTRKLKEFIHIIEKYYGLSNKVIFGQTDQGIGCQNIRCDVSKLYEVFHKNSFIEFEEGIDSVIKAIGKG